MQEEREMDLVAVEPLPHDLIVAREQRRDQNAAIVYLASLAPGSRRTMGDALGIIAGLLLPELREKTVQVRIELLPWGALRFQHTSAVRAVLAEKYSYATVNKMLSALRGTIKTAWRLGQLSAEDYQRAVDVQRVQGETLPAGRSLKTGRSRPSSTYARRIVVPSVRGTRRLWRSCMAVDCGGQSWRR